MPPDPPSACVLTHAPSSIGAPPIVVTFRRLCIVTLSPCYHCDVSIVKSSLWIVIMMSSLWRHHSYIVYGLAGKFCGDFNSAVWRIVRTSPNLNSSANNKHDVMRTTHVHMYTRSTWTSNGTADGSLSSQEQRTNGWHLSGDMANKSAST